MSNLKKKSYKKWINPLILFLKLKHPRIGILLHADTNNQSNWDNNFQKHTRHFIYKQKKMVSKYCYYMLIIELLNIIFHKIK